MLVTILRCLSESFFKVLKIIRRDTCLIWVYNSAQLAGPSSSYVLSNYFKDFMFPSQFLERNLCYFTQKSFLVVVVVVGVIAIIESAPGPDLEI